VTRKTHFAEEETHHVIENVATVENCDLDTFQPHLAAPIGELIHRGIKGRGHAAT
jgi:hypothetical protein